MKVKVTTGAGFGGLAKYQLGKPGTVLLSGAQNNFLRECAALRNLRPDCTKPVLHFSLSQAPGQSLSTEQWRDITDDFLRNMGLENFAHFPVIHNDQNHQHAHIAVCKIATDGKL